MLQASFPDFRLPCIENKISVGCYSKPAFFFQFCIQLAITPATVTNKEFDLAGVEAIRPEQRGDRFKISSPVDTRGHGVGIGDEIGVLVQEMNGILLHGAAIIYG